MAKFSKLSEERLGTCDKRLSRIFSEVVKTFDCVVLCGHRPKVEQDAAVKRGNSKTPWPQSKHNAMPSKAVDVAPFDRPQHPVDWADRERMSFFAGYVLATAASMDIPLRWGGDWDRDTRVADNGFDDLVHFELVD